METHIIRDSAASLLLLVLLFFLSVPVVSADISDSFSTIVLSTNDSSSQFGGIIGTGRSELTNVYYVGSLNCSVSNSDPENCTVAQSNSYFYTYTNAPMNIWDFTTVWDTVLSGSNYPVLIWQNVSAPVVSETTSTNTGGSSGSSSKTTTLTTPIEQSSSPVEESLREKEKLKFTYKGSTHTITMKDVSYDEITIEVASTPKQYTIKKGEFILADVDDDSKPDLKITFVERIYSEAKLLVEAYMVPSKTLPAEKKETTKPVVKTTQEETSNEQKDAVYDEVQELTQTIQTNNETGTKEAIIEHDVQKNTQTSEELKTSSRPFPQWVVVTIMFTLLVAMIVGFFMWYKKL